MNSLPLQLIHWRYYQKGLRGSGHFGEEGNFKKNSLYKATMTACQPRLIH